MIYPLRTPDEVTSWPKLRVYTKQNGSHYVDVAALAYLEGELNYTSLHWADGRHLLIPYTLKLFEEQLPPPYFIRLHRRYLVNRQLIEQLKVGLDGSWIYLKTGTRLPVSRRRLKVVLQLIKSDHQ